MKHNTFCALALAAAAIAATACTRDGVYRPKEKLSLVYEKSSYSASHFDGESWTADTTVNVGKHMTEQWFWDGDFLAAIAYYDEGNRVENTVRFSYNGRQLASASDSYGNVMELTYDGRRLTEAKCSSNGREYAAYAFTHDGSKITQIEVSLASTALKAAAPAHLENAFCKIALPCGPQMAAALGHPAQSKGSLKFTLSLSWDGKNVSKVEKDYNGKTAITEYTYDDKHNPYQGFLYRMLADGESTTLSKNNVLTEKQTDADGHSELSTYTYAYDGNWPIACTTGWQMATDTEKVVQTRMVYFEYKE